MSNWQLFQSFERPEPLPEKALAAVREGIFNRGFPRSSVLEDYAFASVEKGRTLKTNLLAFAHSVHRIPDYAGLTVLNAMNSIDDAALVSTLARSSAPFHLIHRNGEFSFWASAVRNHEADPFSVETHISYDQLDNVLAKYAADLNPQRVIDVKQGRDTFTLPIFHRIQPLQLSLWAADVTRAFLVDHFAQAVKVLRDYARAHPEIGAQDLDLTSLSIQLLGAIILADTNVLGDSLRGTDVSLSDLVEAAFAKFDRYFRLDLFKKYYGGAQEAYYLLRQVCYASFVPDMLSELYRKAYSEEQRKRQGRFDTPLYLTRRIWENIPVEYLPPNQRVAADMTCGWGSFLIAGHERLSSLSDTPTSLRQYLRGNDDDPFTAMLAGLGLLLAASEDSWRIDYQDATRWTWLTEHQPNIIVGNPPFGGDRKEPSTQYKETTVDTKRREEIANNFLLHAIERLAPNGYLAMIMPRSFPSVEASPKLRKQLLEVCDVLELWELPKGVFPATARTIVVFARKKSEPYSPSHTPVRVRTVQPNIYKEFKNAGTFTASRIVINQSAWNEEARKSESSQNAHIMDYKLILPEYAWRTLSGHCLKLQKYAEIIRGAGVGKKLENKGWIDYEAPKVVPWLTGVKRVMPYPFFIDYTKATTIVYPNELERPRKSREVREDKEYILAGTKVLVPYIPDPTWGKRMKVAIERRSYYVSDNFWVVVPVSHNRTSYITHEVLAAVLSWDVSNAWVIEHVKGPSMPKRALETIPFPKSLSESDCTILTKAVSKLEEEASLSHFDSQGVKEAHQAIDSILKAAYHLDEATFQCLRKVMEWDNRPAMTLDPNPESSEANWSISGIVDSIDAEHGTITFWLEGFRDLQTVQIVPTIPGWMLRPEAAFRTKIPRHYVKQGRIDSESADWGAFRPQPYAYMNEEELLEKFSHILHADDPDAVM
jgi:hypothetical protein